VFDLSAAPFLAVLVSGFTNPVGEFSEPLDLSTLFAEVRESDPLAEGAEVLELSLTE
jgi:hypothetical protein